MGSNRLISCDFRPESLNAFKVRSCSQDLDGYIAGVEDPRAEPKPMNNAWKEADGLNLDSKHGFSMVFDGFLASFRL